MQPQPRDKTGDRKEPGFPASLLVFRPWMLALAVFLACAIGIALMEQARDTSMWAQASAPAQRTHLPGR